MSRQLKEKYTVQGEAFRDSISRTYFATTETNSHLLVTQYDPRIVHADRIQSLIDHSERILQLTIDNTLQLIDYHYDGTSFFAIYDNPKSVTPLIKYLKQSPSLNIGQLIQFCRDTLTGLADLERHGLFHGNVSLTSVHVGNDQSIQLMHAFLHQLVIKDAIQVVQKLDSALFLAPEQLTGSSPTSSQTDIYSVGVLAYLLFSNTWPFEFTTEIATVKELTRLPHTPFRGISADLPPYTDQIISIALSKAKTQRFAAVVDMLYKFNTAPSTRIEPDTLPEEKAPSAIKIPPTSRLEILKNKLFRWSPKRTKILGGFLIVMALLAGTNYMLVSYVTGIPEGTVPMLRGLQVEDAMATLEQSGLRGQVAGSRVDYSVPDGTVLESRPTAGSTVKENRIIMIYIAKNGNEFQMPDLVGRSINEASKLLPNPNRPISITLEVPSLDAPEGEILSQTPTAGVMVSNNVPITVTLSRGFPISVRAEMSGSQCKITVQCSVAPSWPDQAVKIVHKTTNTQVLHSSVLKEADALNLEFLVEAKGEIIVYFSNRIAYSNSLQEILSGSIE